MEEVPLDYDAYGDTGGDGEEEEDLFGGEFDYLLEENLAEDETNIDELLARRLAAEEQEAFEAEQRLRALQEEEDRRLAEQLAGQSLGDAGKGEEEDADAKFARMLFEEEERKRKEQEERDRKFAEEFAKQQQGETPDTKADLAYALSLMREEEEQQRKDEEMARRMQAERDAEIARKMQEREDQEKIRRDAEIARKLHEQQNTSLTKSVETAIDSDDASDCLGAANLAELKRFMNCYTYGAWKLRRVLKPSLVSNFERCKAEFAKKGVSSHVILAFHGTKAANINSISDKGLLMPGQVKVAHGSAYGRGIYVSPDPAFSLGYAPEGRLFVCAVLPGASFDCNKHKRIGNGCMPGYHSHVANQKKIIVLFKSAQVLPVFVLERCGHHVGPKTPYKRTDVKLVYSTKQEKRYDDHRTYEKNINTDTDKGKGKSSGFLGKFFK